VRGHGKKKYKGEKKWQRKIYQSDSSSSSSSDSDHGKKKKKNKKNKKQKKGKKTQKENYFASYNSDNNSSAHPSSMIDGNETYISSSLDSFLFIEEVNHDNMKDVDDDAKSEGSTSISSVSTLDGGKSNTAIQSGKSTSVSDATTEGENDDGNGEM